MQLGKDAAKLLDGSKPAGNAAVGDEGDRLGLPLALGRVDDSLQRRGERMVVFGSDHHDSVGGGKLRIPVSRIEAVQRIDDADRSKTPPLEFGADPAGDHVAEAAFAGAAIDDAEF